MVGLLFEIFKTIKISLKLLLFLDLHSSEIKTQVRKCNIQNIITFHVGSRSFTIRLF